jgi:hypothetical protein
MKRRTRNTWILLAVVVALGLAVMGEVLRQRRTAPQPLLSGAGVRVDEVRVECQSCVPRAFRRVQGRWRMTEPWLVSADQDEVARLLDVAKVPVRRRFEPTLADPKALGFATPFAVLTLGPHRIEFGGTDAIDHWRYVRAGQGVALVRDSVSVQLLAAPERFVDRRATADLREGLAAVIEGSASWPEADRQRLADLHADDVVAHGDRVAERPLILRDGTGVDHAFGLTHDGTRLLLLREQPALAFVVPADIAAALDR